jgi:type II secretory pathway pseudopilin PulG
MDTQPRNTRHGRRLPPPAGEGGFLLVMVMVVLLIVSAIASSTLINSFLERSLAKNLNYASVALQAADGGLSVGQAWIHENMDFIFNPMTDLDFYTNAAKYNWSRTICSRPNALNPNCPAGAAEFHAIPGGGDYVVTMRFKREWYDSNGDGFCKDPGEISQYTDHDNPPPGPTTACPSWPAAGSGEIVIYNRLGSATTPVDKCFGFPPSRAPGNIVGKEGYPVIEITSVGTYGNAGYRKVVLDVARNLIAIAGAKGAITAAGGVNFGPSAAQIKDGRDHKLDGSLGHLNPVCNGALGAKQPDVFVEAGKPVDIGKPATCLSDGAATVNPGAPMVDIYTPWGAMGYNTEAEMVADTANVITFPAGSAHATVAAAIQPGIVVYYQGTDDFQPGSKTGVLVTKGRFRQRGGEKFTGLVVAQGVDLAGTTTVIGAIVTWDPNSSATWGNGTMDILYSCDALVQGIGNAGWESRLSWNRLR